LVTAADTLYRDCALNSRVGAEDDVQVTPAAPRTAIPKITTPNIEAITPVPVIQPRKRGQEKSCSSLITASLHHHYAVEHYHGDP
jgi:hypothetical protein